MNRFSELNTIMNEISKEKTNEINPIIKKYNIITDKAIQEFINFKIGEILKFDCRGSGYIGRYCGVENSYIILDLCNKKGISKNKKLFFYCNQFDNFHKI